MTQKKKNKKGTDIKTVVEIGAGVAALGALTYLFLGPKGKKNQKEANSWAVKMKGEILQEFKKAQKITEPLYHQMIEKVQAKYSKIKGIDKKELESVVAEAKKHWKVVGKKAKTKKAVKTKLKSKK